MIILTLKKYEKSFEMSEETFEELAQEFVHDYGRFGDLDIEAFMHNLSRELRSKITTRRGFGGEPDQFGYPREFKAFQVFKQLELKSANFKIENANSMLFERLEDRRQYEEARTGLRLYWKDIKFVQVNNDPEGMVLCAVEALLHRQMPNDGFVSPEGVYYRFEQIRQGVKVPEFEQS